MCICRSRRAAVDNVDAVYYVVRYITPAALLCIAPLSALLHGVVLSYILKSKVLDST